MIRARRSTSTFFAVRADDDRQLGFEIGLMLGKRDLDRAVVREQRTGRFEPNQRRADLGPLHFLDMIAVIQADRDDLARRHREIDREFV